MEEIKKEIDAIIRDYSNSLIGEETAKRLIIDVINKITAEHAGEINDLSGGPL